MDIMTVTPKPLWKKFPKFRKGTFRKYKHLFGETAKFYFKRKKPRFFRTKEGTIIASGIEGYGGYYTTILMKSEGRKEFELAGECSHFIKKNGIEITGAFTTTRKNGVGLFRFFLNDAITIAKKQRYPAVLIEAENENLAKYYSRFGFKFVGLKGVLSLPVGKK